MEITNCEQYVLAELDYEHGEENAAELWNERVEPNGN